MILTKTVIIGLDLLVIAALLLCAGFSYRKLSQTHAEIARYDDSYASVMIDKGDKNYHARDAKEAYGHSKGMEYWQVESDLRDIENFIRMPLYACVALVCCAIFLLFSLPAILHYAAAGIVGLLGAGLLVMGCYSLLVGDPIGKIASIEKFLLFGAFASAALLCFLNTRFMIG